MSALSFITTKLQPGEEILLIKEFDLIFCSCNPVTGKLNFIILTTLERLSICLFNEAMFRFRTSE